MSWNKNASNAAEPWTVIPLGDQGKLRDMAMGMWIDVLSGAAMDAGIKVPPPGKFDDDEYPHYVVFMNVMYETIIQPDGSLLPPPLEKINANARIIAAVPADKIKTTTLADLIALGYKE